MLVEEPMNKVVIINGVMYVLLNSVVLEGSLVERDQQEDKDE